MQKKAPIPLNDCGLVKAIGLIGDKWSLLILREVLYGVIRFDDIQKELNIPKSTLSQRINNLVSNGILERNPYKESKSRTRYAYSPTEAGAKLVLPLLSLMQWSDKYINSNNSPLTIVDRDTSEELTVKLSTSDGREVSVDKIKMVIHSINQS
jgi:DNA-binding HxlR family transcriptional regulator